MEWPVDRALEMAGLSGRGEEDPFRLSRRGAAGGFRLPACPCGTGICWCSMSRSAALTARRNKKRAGEYQPTLPGL